MSRSRVARASCETFVAAYSCGDLTPLRNVSRRIFGFVLGIAVLVSCAHAELPASSHARQGTSLRAAAHDHGSVALSEHEGRALADVIRTTAKLTAPDAVERRSVRMTSPRRPRTERRRARIAAACLPRRALYPTLTRAADAPDPPA